jgi:CrcB protein
MGGKRRVGKEQIWREWVHLGLIAAGGSMGAITRYKVSGWVLARTGPRFPWGTLLINVTGSFILGFLGTLVLERFIVSRTWYYLGAIGFLGAYTTYSTFSYETIRLILDGSLLRALANAFVSVGLGIVAAWIGVVLGRVL